MAKTYYKVICGEEPAMACSRGRVRGRTMQDTNAQGWFSALEQRVWDVLGAAGAGPLYGKQIAKRLNRSYDAELKGVLQNLVGRGLLTHRRGEGYRRAE